MRDKIATQIEVGLDFCIALGQDCEQRYEFEIPPLDQEQKVEKTEEDPIESDDQLAVAYGSDAEGDS